MPQTKSAQESKICNSDEHPSSSARFLNLVRWEDMISNVRQVTSNAIYQSYEVRLIQGGAIDNEVSESNQSPDSATEVAIINDEDESVGAGEIFCTFSLDDFKLIYVRKRSKPHNSPESDADKNIVNQKTDINSLCVGVTGEYDQSEGSLVDIGQDRDRLDFNSLESGRYKLKKLSNFERHIAMCTFEIHAGSHGNRRLTKDLLEQEGLTLSYVLITGTLRAFFSPVFQFGHKPAVLASVKNGNEGFVLRTYYLSGSHCSWKHLPYYTGNWFGKGHGQDAILVDLPYQWALSEIMQIQNKPLQINNPKLMFMGTARDKYQNDSKRSPISHMADVHEKPIVLEGNFYKGNKRKNSITPPEEMLFDDESTQMPDFSFRIKNWAIISPIYGNVHVDVFPSLDRKFTYMFCRDEEGRAWISGIYANSPRTTTGVRKEWVDAGDLTTPAFDYESESGGYGNKTKGRKGYVDMFEKYLSKVPVIQEYLRCVKK